MKGKLLTALATVASSLLWATGAFALPVSVDASLTAPGIAPFTNICSGNGNCSSPTAVSVGSWSISASVSGTPPQTQGTLLSQTIDVETSGSGTIWIFANETGLDQPAGDQQLGQFVHGQSSTRRLVGSRKNMSCEQRCSRRLQPDLTSGDLDLDWNLRPLY